MRAFLPWLSILVVIPCLGCVQASGQAVTHIRVSPAPWSPPKADVSEPWIDATQFLLQLGIGDPRGGEYRTAKILLGNVWGGDPRTDEAKGWLLPNGKFVAWDGLAYTPVSVGEKADIESDVAALVQGGSSGLIVGHVQGDATPKLSASSVPVCLLLIRGETALAQKLLDRVESANPRSSFHRDLSKTAAYALLTVWFERAVTAHMRGDDKLAADDSSAIVAARDVLVKADANAVKEGDFVGVRFTFLQPIDQLLADSDRRLSEPGRGGSGDRISMLIRELDQVKARQSGQPGGVSLTEDPIVQELIKQGTPAVEPLLDCIEKDDRLTRSVSFGRDFFPGRNLLTVKSAAFAAFCDIVEYGNFSNEPGTPPTIAFLRQWWEENKTKTGPERWMSVLADDKASYQQWREAAGRMTEDTTIQHRGGWVTLARPGSTGALKGESARSKSNPSVTDLLARRAVQMAGSGEVNNSMQMFEAGDGARIARMLAIWDPKAAVPVLAKVSDRCAELLKDTRMGSSVNTVGQPYAELQSRRITIGDYSGLPAYVDWLSQTPPSETFGSELRTVAPFLFHSENPTVISAAKRLFGEPNSLWTPARMAHEPRSNRTLEVLIASRVVQLASFRKGLLGLLDDKTVIGEAWPQENGGARYAIPKGSSGGSMVRASSTADPYAQDKSHRPYRVCDFVAWSLTNFTVMPDFLPYWPEAIKDRAIATAKSVLTQNGAAICQGTKFPFEPPEP